MAIPTVQPAEAALEELLSRPTPALSDTLKTLAGDFLILGAGGKMGPSLARLAVRAVREAGTRQRVIAAARFTMAGLRDALERDGIETLECDLLVPGQAERLPDAANLIYMVGQKFGTTGDEARTWAVNAFAPGLVAQRFRGARIVAFSTGNVYPLWPTDSMGPSEADPVGPLGEYAASALARERVLTFFSCTQGTPMALLRLNYAIEPRYGVLRDIADQVWRGEPAELGMGKVNLIWQRDANAIALRALAYCAVPPLVLNVTGPAHSVRELAEAFARRWNRAPQFSGQPAETALLSNPARLTRMFGPPEVGITEMIEQVAAWVERGGRSLGKPTHFEEREGRF